MTAHIFSLEITLIGEILALRYYPFPLVITSKRRVLPPVPPIPICPQNLESKQTDYATG